MRDMTNLIEVNEGTMGGDVFYGNIRINGANVMVSKLTEPGKKYRFRYTAKARAGFPVICDIECNVESLPYYLSKNTTVVEVERTIPGVIGGGKSYWFHVLTTKGGKWHSIDKSLLESLTVGDMHGAFPKMIDWNIWKRMNTKFHSCKSFVYNTPKAA